MKLSWLLGHLGDEIVSLEPAGSDPEITGLEYDSRRVQPGNLFFAITGFQADGLKFVPQARERGAAAVACEAPVFFEGLTTIRVRNVRRAMALISAQYYGRPADGMMTVAITGTAGKTTTSYMLRSILQAAGRRTGLVGTIRYLIGEQELEAPNTTPESLDLQRMLAQMSAAGIQALVMEASSHGIELDRVTGIDFRTAVFTNLSQDHLDFHGNMEDYFRSKLKLFVNLKDDSWAVVNRDDPRGQEILKQTRARKLTYGQAPGADVRAEDVSTDIQGSVFRLAYAGHRAKVNIAFPGRHNVSNALAAAAAAIALGVSLNDIGTGLETLKAVDGRMERVDEGQDFSVMVDYAHTPEELARLLAAVRDLKPRRIITVFGCGGDRDRSKRPLMGRAVAEGSDIIIVTSDNPRTEDPLAIIQDILPGLGEREHLILPDRRQAIVRAMELAQPGDMVIIAGKGHEDYQIIGRTKIHFDDREEARQALIALKREGRWSR